MDAKKILIVSRTFFPENTPRAFRTTELAKELSRKGHIVTVITPRSENVHNAFEKEHHITIKDLGQLKWKPVSIAGTNGIQKTVKRILARATNLLFVYPESESFFKVKKALKKEKEKYDLLITIAAPHSVHWGTAAALTMHGPVANKWIADCGDPFMGGENDTFKRLFYFKHLEKWFCRKADVITIPIEEAKEAYYPEFRNKIQVIPQGFRFEDVVIPSVKEKNSVPTFAFAGSLIPGIRDPHEFFEYIRQLKTDYKFIIYTNNTAYVKKYAQLNNRIELRDALPRFKLLEVLSSMDFVVNFENKGVKQSPSKLIDYAIIDKPILSVKTFGFNPRVTDEFLQGDYTNQVRINDVDQYRIENVCQKFISLS